MTTEKQTTACGTLVKSRRTDRKISQKKLADMLKCTPVFICRIESGLTGIPPEYTDKFAEALRTSKQAILRAITEDLITKMKLKAATNGEK